MLNRSELYFFFIKKGVLVKSFYKLSLHSIKDKLERRKFQNLYHLCNSGFGAFTFMFFFFFGITERIDLTLFIGVLISTEVVKEKTVQTKHQTKSAFNFQKQCRMYVYISGNESSQYDGFERILLALMLSLCCVVELYKLFEKSQRVCLQDLKAMCHAERRR